MTQVANDRRDAGDVGRRIAERQGELKLTIVQVAERVGMATDYLEYLEHTPTADPSPSAVLRALALEMSASGTPRWRKRPGLWTGQRGSRSPSGRYR